MKKINIILLLSVFFSFFSCDKGNYYYENYDNRIVNYDGDIYQYLEHNKGIFDSLLLVLDRLHPYQDTLATKEVTLFAPTNQSFSLALLNLNTQRKLSKKHPVSLESIDLEELDSLMGRYIVPELITTASIKALKDGIVKTTIKNNYEMHVKYNVLNASGYVGGGQQQIVFTDPNNSIFERYWEKTTTNSVNILANNGVIHILTPNHNFGFGKLGKYTN